MRKGDFFKPRRTAMNAQYLLTISLIATSLLAIEPASAASASASSYYPSTGRTTTSTANPDGSHTVTVTDAKGNSSSTVRGKRAPGIYVGDGNGGYKRYDPPAKPPAGPTGISVGDGNGGCKPYNPPAKPPAGPTGISVGDGNGGWKPYNPPPKLPASASSFDPSTGRTTTSTRNADGSHTVTVR